MKGLTVGELMDEIRHLVERGDIRLDDPAVLVDCQKVTTVIPMSGFAETENGYEFKPELEEDTRRLVFLYGE